MNEIHNTDRLGTHRINRLLWEFSVPAIIGMVVNAIYNIVDRIYVGQMPNGDLGIAGITIVMPAMMVMMALSMFIGIGSNSLFAIRMGEGHRDEVEKIMGNAFVLLFFVPAIGIAACFIFLDDIIIHVLGASEAVFPYAKTYLQIILYGAIFSAMGPGINHFIRSDGHPRTSMVTQLVGAIINIILDPIFIFGFDWGIAGAAWATIISQFISFVWVMWYFNSKLTALRFRPQFMKLERRIVFPILTIGFAPFVMQLAMSLVGVLQNHALNTYGGDTAVSAMGIVYSIMIIFFMPLQGINQGAQPIIGYNYGAKKYDRVIKTYTLAVIAGTVFITVGFLLIQIFSHLFIALFRNEEGDLMDLSIFCLRVSTMVFPLIAFQIFTSQYFQAIGKPVQSTILSLSRQLLFYIPLLLLLPKTFGLNGVFFAMPAADILAVLLSAAFMTFELKRLHTQIKR
ncbi:MATE family efflux transporter [Spirochaetia bacterium]|nr:MATE family efflux transporter [Spirochaetia bacterium]